MIKEHSKEVKRQKNMETLNKIGEIFKKYERQFIDSVNHYNRTGSETVLLGFCIRLSHLREPEQIFIVRTFFMHMMAQYVSHKKHIISNEQLQVKMMYIAHQISVAKNISDFIEMIPSFVNTLIPIEH